MKTERADSAAGPRGGGGGGWTLLRLAPVAVAALLVGAAMFWSKPPVGPAFDLGPFADAYALQQRTGLDLGYLPEERFPGHGGSGEAAAIRLRLHDIDFLCRPARFGLFAVLGVVRSGELHCGLESDTPPARMVEELLARFEASPDWRLRRDLRCDERRLEEWGRTVDSALSFANWGGFGFPVDKVPLVSFVHVSSGSGVEIGLGLDRRAAHGPDLRVFISFFFESPCVSELHAFEAADVKPESTSPEHYAGIRRWFGGRRYSEIPIAEWVAGASKYLREGCGGGGSP
ncbi:MAG: hypothetical protein ACK5MQ_17205 [Pikeienuella sp.]